MGYKSPAQKKFLLRNQAPGVRRFTARYGSEVERSVNKGSTPRRKGFLSRISSGGYRGV